MGGGAAVIVWLASYPRSGNTFLRVVLKQAFHLDTCSLYGDRQDIARHPETTAVVGHRPLPRGFSVTRGRAAKRRYLIKTHERGPSPQDAAIYLIRDGRECLWSYQNYLRDFWGREVSLGDLVRGRVDFGGWAEHVASWDPDNRPNTLLLRYEDLITDTGGAIDRLAAFLHARPRAHQLKSFEELQRVNPRMFRCGDRGAWKPHFNRRLRSEFWHRHGAVMERYGYRRAGGT